MTIHFPAEFSFQAGVILTWPHLHSIWAETLERTDPIFVEIVKQISRREKLILIYYDDPHYQKIIRLLENNRVNTSSIYFYCQKTNDVWARDYGPLTIIENGRCILLNFQFNAWGKKYPHELDNNVTEGLYAQKAFPNALLKNIPWILEGGSIETDGYGTLITTEHCLLEKNRNPTLFSKEKISKLLRTLLGIKRVLWLKEGKLSGDDTDGHIDTLVRFINPHTLVYVKCDDPHDIHYGPLKLMEAELSSWRDYQDNSYQLIPLPWPKACYADYDGRRLPLTYANFLIINDAVLLPFYDDVNDLKALSILQTCFPSREIVPIPSKEIIQWYGSIHCLTMQLPAEVKL